MAKGKKKKKKKNKNNNNNNNNNKASKFDNRQVLMKDNYNFKILNKVRPKN